MVPLAGLEPATHPHLGCTLTCYKHVSLPLSYRGIGIELEWEFDHDCLEENLVGAVGIEPTMA